jgi:hypothetical protein
VNREQPALTKEGSIVNKRRPVIPATDFTGTMICDPGSPRVANNSYKKVRYPKTGRSLIIDHI